MTDTLRGLVDEVILAFGPLIDAAQDAEAFKGLLADLGWTINSIPQPLLQLADAGSDVVNAIGSDEAEVSTAQAFDAVRRLVDAIDAIRTAPDSAFPSEVDVASFKATIGRDLLDYALVDYLLRSRHKIGGLLRFGGLIRLVDTPAAGLRQRYQKREVAWSAFGDLVRDPRQGLRDTFEWDSASPRLAEALGYAATLLESYGLGLTYFQPAGALLSFITADASTPLDEYIGAKLSFDEALGAPAGFAAGVRLVLRPPTNTRGAALSLMPFAELSGAEEIPLASDTSLSIASNADFAKGIAITLAPGHPTETQAGFLGGAPVGPADINIALTFTPPAETPERLLIGTADGSRLAAKRAMLSVGARLVSSDSLDLFLELALANARVVIQPAPDEGDSFLAGVLGADGISADVSFGVRLSSATGFHLTGSAGLEASFPLSLQLGPLEVRALSIGLKPSSQRVTVEAGATVAANIGPIGVVVDDVGFALSTTFADPPTGNLGPLDVAFGFKPPSGVGLSVDAHGTLTGGGFLFHDAAQGLYAGAMQLSFQDQLTLTAYGLIATIMPDGSRGYSLLIFITAEGFRPIPLGFGFMLQSIGGIVAVNRTFSQDVIRAGLQSDTLATLLFPRDPVTNAPALIQALSAAFPAQQGSYLLGLIARITWFTPTLVQLDLALILEFGARNRLLALARISALLPSRDNDLIRLHMDALGVLDFDAGTLAIDAVLVDSRIAHKFPITGSAALRAHWPSGGGADAGTSFVLAVGGLNPRFTAPAGFPQLERVAIALCSGSNPRLICDSYLAITSNTVQFGARASLYAEAIGFSVSGDLGFDALITLLPPHFIVDFHAAVQLKRGSHNLFKVTLDGTLEGPLPLRIAARAKFEILWFSFSVHFDFTLAAGDVADAVPAVSLVTELTKALADPASWSTRRAPTLAHGVALRSVPASAPARLDPLGQLVVQQQVVPLNTGRDVDTYGGQPVAGPRRFNLAATLNGQSGTPVSGAFAPARYFVMSDDDKLAAPSFETMDAGLVLGDAAITFDDATIVAAPLEYESIVLNAPASPNAAPPAGLPSAPVPERYQMPLAALAIQRPTGAAARVPVRSVGRERFRNATAVPAATLTAQRWRIVQISDGAQVPVEPGITTWTEYRADLAIRNRGGARWLMAPTYELAAS